MKLTISPKRRRLLIIIGGAILAVAFIVMAIIDTYRGFTGSGQGGVTTNITKDPTSGESFVHQEGVVPESQVNNNTPIFAGFGTLIDWGFTSGQLSSLQQALQRYKPFAKGSVQISLAVSDIHKNAPDTADPLSRWSISSHIVINQKDTYQIKCFYWDASSVQLLLYDATGKTQLFDSGTVTS